MYPQSIFLAKIGKLSLFLSENYHFSAVKNHSILHWLVIVICYSTFIFYVSKYDLLHNMETKHGL